jgi:hypothetical protein
VGRTGIDDVLLIMLKSNSLQVYDSEFLRPSNLCLVKRWCCMRRAMTSASGKTQRRQALPACQTEEMIARGLEVGPLRPAPFQVTLVALRSNVAREDWYFGPRRRRVVSETVDFGKRK